MSRIEFTDRAADDCCRPSPQTDETRGILKAVADPETHRILVAATAGIEGGEVMSVIERAIIRKTALHRFGRWRHRSP